MLISGSAPALLQAPTSPSRICLPSSDAPPSFITENGLWRQAPVLPLSTGIPASPSLLNRPQLKLNSGQILVPSGGFSNDAARARNSGSRLRPKAPTLSPKAGNKMGKSASETKLGSLPSGVQGSQCLSASSSAFELKTPRTVRGMVRKTSCVAMQYYPDLQAMGASSPSSWGSQGTVSQRASKTNKDGQRLNETASWILEGSRKEMTSMPGTVPSSPSSRPASPRMRMRVTWADKVGEELAVKAPAASFAGIAKEGSPSAAVIKSRKLMDGLYKLRRVGGGDADTPESPTTVEVGEEPMDEEQLTLMNQTLSSCTDTEAELRITQAMLEGAHEPVAELGGARHATTLVSGRTLTVVRRKAEIVQRGEAILTAFQNADDKRERLFTLVADGNGDVPDGYKGAKRNINSLVHRNTNGAKINPAEADKAPFDVFAVSFFLPPEHTTLVLLKGLAVDATDWWAAQTLQEALKGADADRLQRLINVTIAFLDISETGHAQLVEVRTVLGDRLSEKVLAIAKKLSAKDAGVVERSVDAQPGNARDVADKIDEEIKEAVRLGAPNKHAMLLEAKQIATSFHLEEKNRWALKALQFAQFKQVGDTKMAEKAGDKVPPVGPASDAGDAIEREVRDCVKKGAPDDHPRCNEARQIMKALRDLDGERKRLAAREKRLAESAAKK